MIGFVKLHSRNRTFFLPIRGLPELTSARRCLLLRKTRLTFSLIMNFQSRFWRLSFRVESVRVHSIFFPWLLSNLFIADTTPWCFVPRNPERTSEFVLIGQVDPSSTRIIIQSWISLLIISLCFQLLSNWLILFAKNRNFSVISGGSL